MAGDTEDEEIKVLRKELAWLLKEEVHPVLQDIKETLQLPKTEDDRLLVAEEFEEKWNCPHIVGAVRAVDGKHVVLHCPRRSGKKSSHQDVIPDKIVLTPPVGSSLNFRSMVTLKGDTVEATEIHFKHKQGKEHHIFKTTFKSGFSWKLPQIRDAGHHLSNALEIVSKNDSSYEYTSVKEVFMLLDELMDCLMKCRQCLSLPKRKSIQDLLDNKSLLMFNPPLPSDIAVSFYIHTSKLVLALYCLHQNSQHKVEITHRVQVESAVRWLNEGIVFFTLSLQQCQQLKDKLGAVSQILDHP